MLAIEELPTPSKPRLQATDIEVAAFKARSEGYFIALDEAVCKRHLGDAAGGR